MRPSVLASRFLLLLLCVFGMSRSPALAQLTGEESEYWTQNVPGVPGEPESFEFFGYVLENGDFDGDGFDDLVVDVLSDGELRAGGVHVFYGSPEGLSTADQQYWSQDSPGVPGTSEEFDRFGFALAAGDFDYDGFDDLAIGIPGKVVNGADDAGSVVVLYGTAAGLSAAGSQLWNDLNLPISLDFRDTLGASLAAGYFDGDAYADLAIGVPSETVLGVDNAGAVLVLYGSATGLTQTGIQTWHQDVPGVVGEAELDERFGQRLAAGNFDGDAYDDLAVSVSGDIVDGVDAGSVNVFYGSSVGLSAAGNQLWNQGVAGVGSTPESDDGFGWSMAAGDFFGTGIDGLAIGVPFEEAGAFTDMGVVHLLYGSESSGLTGTGSLLLRQGVSGLPGELETSSLFGFALAAGDFEGDGFEDLAIGAAGDDTSTVDRAGTVTVLFGTSTGIRQTGGQYWSEASPSVPGVPATGDGFGAALVAGDFRGDGGQELAIGVQAEQVEGVAAGAVIVLNGVSVQIFFDGFESGDTTGWDTWTP